MGLKDRTLNGTMVYTSPRVGAMTRMLVEHVYTRGRRTRVRLHARYWSQER